MFVQKKISNFFACQQQIHHAFHVLDDMFSDQVKNPGQHVFSLQF